ncbi:MAG: hypothetical protein M3O70_03875, partial [Actinomycetota bacterium]|nr:hypothetical protein [Actinomycetota bacterium]
MQIPLIVVGATLIVAMMLDIAWTTLSVSSGRGPVTGALGRGLWAVALKLGRSRRRLQLAGHLIVAGLLATWIVLLWLGLFALLSSDPLAVTDSTTQQPASGLARLAFAAGAVAGAGAGYVAGKPIWQLVNNLGAVLGLAGAAMAVSHLISLATAAVAARATALRIAGLGRDPVSVVRSAIGTERGCQQLAQVLLDLTSPVAAMARQHLAFPELRYLQVVQRKAAVEPNIVVLDEVVTLLRVGSPDCVGQVVLGPLRSALDDFLETVPLHRVPQEAPPLPDLSKLSQVLPQIADGSQLQSAFAQERDRRRRLMALLQGAGWDWEEAVEGR